MLSEILGWAAEGRCFVIEDVAQSHPIQVMIRKIHTSIGIAAIILCRKKGDFPSLDVILPDRKQPYRSRLMNPSAEETLMTRTTGSTCLSNSVGAASILGTNRTFHLCS